ncbi:MAG: hypothetical protein WC860_02250 [Candidatus Margulisiibacteriota bacterium]|jgi:hypothetical protein
MNKDKGSILIFILVFMLILIISISTLSIALNLFVKSLVLEINHKKAYYLAQSGLNIAPYYFDAIPIKNIPLSDEKGWLYNHLFEGLLINRDLDGEIILFKSQNNTIYAVGLVQKKARSILKESFTITENKITFYNWEKL